MAKVTIYHLTKPMTADQANLFAADLNKNITLPPIAPLGNQSNGFFFFTTRQGADNHAKFQQELNSLNSASLTNLYMVSAQIDTKDVKYPTWQLDYEATRDYFFELFFNIASQQAIKFQDVVVSTNGKVLQIQDGTKIMKLRDYSPEHSGFIERVVAYLYLKNKKFQDDYNKLLQNVMLGNGDDTVGFAVKTTKCPKLVSFEKINNTIQPIQSTQIAKWFDRYRR